MKNILFGTSSIWKTALASGLSWEIAKWTGTTRPYFAPLAAVLCLQVTVEESIVRGYQRVLGIVVGVLLADFTARYIGIHGWSIALLVILGIGLASWLRLGKQAIPQVGVSAIMVLTIGTAGQFLYSIDRVVDTLIGAVMAVLINMFVLPPDFTKQASSSLSDTADKLAEKFLNISNWLKKGADLEEGYKLQEETRRLLNPVHKVVEDVEQALHALRFSPLVEKRREALRFYSNQLLHIRQGYAHATGMLRTLLEWQNEKGIEEQDRQEWSQWFADLAKVINSWREFTSLHHEAVNQQQSKPTLPLPPSSAQNHFLSSIYNDALQLIKDFTIDEDQTGH